jgi:O-antigen/teichoic acid export membrane protein
MSMQMPVLMLSYYFGGVVTGFYALGYRVLQLPMRFVGQSISQVYFSSAADANLAGNVGSTTDKVFRNLLVISLPFFVLVGIIAPELFSVVFGASWQKAGEYVQILMPWFFLAFIATPLSMLVSVLGRQATELILQIIFLAFLAVSFVIGGMQRNADLSIFLFSLTGSLYSLGKILWLLNISGNSINSSLKFIFREIFSISPLAAFLFIVKAYAGSDIVVSLVGIAAILFVAVRMTRRYRTFELGGELR